MLNRHLYALADGPSDPRKSRGAFPIAHSDAEHLNRDGFGIFWAINIFKDAKRVKQNLSHVLSWAIDIDEGTKIEQFKKIEAGPTPSLLIETKRGFHVYWDCEDGDEDNWRDIVEFRLIPHFGGDPKAKDLCRILRAPWFYHLKDPTSPFLIKEVFKSKSNYRAKSFMKLFDVHEKEVCYQEIRQHIGGSGEKLSDRIYNMNCIEALSRLSGHGVVGGETYEFRRNGNGNHNIIINGKSTSCFIDENKRIGAHPGGPTIFRWLKYYNHSDQEIIRILRQYFPELWQGL